MNQTSNQYWHTFETPWGPVTAVGAQKLRRVELGAPTPAEKELWGQEIEDLASQGNLEDPVSFGGFEAWLNAYIAGEKPSIAPVEVQWPEDATPFCLWVWQSLAAIPWGSIVTYGDLARRWERQQDGRMAAQAVGGALRRNPLPLLYPCHRVLGANGAITGYAGGKAFKHDLLAHEHALEHVRPSER